MVEPTSKKPENIVDCLATFVNWPLNAALTPSNLSNVGFYYCSDDSTIKCYCCSATINDLPFGIAAIDLHRNKNPSCPIVQWTDHEIKARPEAYSEHWREKSFTRFDPSFRKELAASGFYEKEKTGRLVCAFCDVEIEPKENQSVSFQHRQAVKKRGRTHSILDCQMVRAVSVLNVPIEDRQPFPEYPQFSCVADRRATFKTKFDPKFIQQRVEAGFFLESSFNADSFHQIRELSSRETNSSTKLNNEKRMRCFQCGNQFPVLLKKWHQRYPQYDVMKIHAHCYPSCEWVKTIVGPKFVEQILRDRGILTESGNLSKNPFVRKSSFNDKYLVIDEDANVYNSNDEQESDDDDENEYRPLMPTSLVRPNENPFERVQHENSSKKLCVEQISFEPTRREFLSEKNRLESFHKGNRRDFAGFSVDELSNAGFYLTECQTISCPWCRIEMSENRLKKILVEPPALENCLLSGEAWTPMRIHRHEIGQIRDHQNGPSWCPHVRRRINQNAPNQIIKENFLRFPEYRNFAQIEKRISSFKPDWPYSDGTQLSRQIMATAGFVYSGNGRVCCFFCGNRWRNFRERDCPFEEHAAQSPLCDYLRTQRDDVFIENCFARSPPIENYKFTTFYSELGQRVVRVSYGRTENSLSKTDRCPATRSESMFSSHVQSESLCQICFEYPPRFYYEPCQHFPFCSSCEKKLPEEQRTVCAVCRQSANIGTL